MRAWILGGVAAAFLCASPARADKKDAGAPPAPIVLDEAALAAEDFAEGQKAFEAADYVRAGTKFESAYKHKPHHAPLWNAARSWARAGEDVRAANLYAKYLREAPANAPDRDAAIKGLNLISPKVARLETHADAEVRNVKVDGKPLEDPNLYVAPGEHTAEGDYKGKAVTKTVKVAAGERVSVSLTKPAPAVVIKEEPKPLPPVISFIGAGLALVGGGFTIASGAGTVQDKHAFLDDQMSQSKLDTAQSSQTRTNVILGTTVGVAVLTGVAAIFFTDWKSL